MTEYLKKSCWLIYFLTIISVLFAEEHTLYPADYQQSNYFNNQFSFYTTGSQDYYKSSPERYSNNSTLDYSFSYKQELYSTDRELLLDMNYSHSNAFLHSKGFGSRDYTSDADQVQLTYKGKNYFPSSYKDSFWQVNYSGAETRQTAYYNFEQGQARVDSNSALTLLIGVGRIDIATDLVRAKRIEDYLLSLNALGQRFDNLTLKKIADVIYESRNTMPLAKPDTYQLQIAQQVLDVIKESPDWQGSADTYVVMRIQEVIFQENIYQRKHGSDLAIGTYFNQDFSSSYIGPRFGSLVNRNGVGLYANYWQALDWDWGVELSGSLRRDLSAWSKDYKADEAKYNYSQGKLQFTYEVDNNTDLSIGWDAETKLIASKGNAVDDIFPNFVFTQNSFAEFRLYVENDILISFSKTRTTLKQNPTPTAENNLQFNETNQVTIKKVF